ncbi:MAG TPA: CoB--CoM heterodisulfide reductase iron-sulfur subunit A family protein [Desulfuromonadaceae bacterium]
MKTGVYFCTCGTNIGDRIDSDKVRERLEPSGLMSYFKVCPFLCSEEGKQFLEQDLRAEQPDRIVIAACSPREHEATFMRVMGDAAMNPFLMQMVNIREQIAWVTEEPDRAVAKAATAIRAALKRVQLHEQLERQELEASPDVLVIGAGPAGLRAALSLAEAGRKVTLVERSPAIGGLPVMYEELFPNMECGPCMLEPLMGEVLHGEQSPNIEILTMAEVEGVAGYFGNFVVKVRQRPRYVDSRQCIGCGECFEPCPASGPNPYNCGMDERKAIAFTVMGALPNAPSIDPALCTRFTAGSDCTACSAACPMGEGVVVYDDQERLLERQVGAIVIATGAALYDCSRFPNLGYGRLPDVRTAFELERMLASNGPTGGQVLAANNEPPRSVVLVHCVGSLDDGHQPYCSGICCQYAFKFNHLLETKLPDATVHHLYREIVSPGKEEYALHQAARHNPRAVFTRYDAITDLTVVEEAGRQQLRLGDGTIVDADLVVLCPAVVPNPDAERLGAMLDVSQDRFGFFEELHGRLDSARSKLRGIYLAGACQAPTDIQRATNQAMAASGYILSELVEGRKIELDPLFASVYPERCSGCKVCQKVCPYGAISFDEENNVSVVNAVLCHGCGTCVAACPLGAIKASHFTNAMILAEIEGVLS